MMLNRKLMVLIIIVIVISGTVAAANLILDADDKNTLTVAYSNKVCYEPLILANHLGLYAEEGVRVRCLMVTGGIQAAEALATGSVDIAAMGDAPALILLSQNPEMRIIARYGGGEGMHRFIAWSDITKPSDLEGKRLGIQYGSSTHGAFLSWSDRNGVDIERMTLVPLSPTDMPEAMATRQIDAMAGSEPWPTNVERVCGSSVHEIGDSTDLGNTFPLVLVTTKRTIESRGEAVQSMMNALAMAIELVEEDRTEAASICCTYTGLSAQDQLSCMSSLFYGLGFNETDVESLELTASFLVQHGKIKSAPFLDECVDLRFIVTTGSSTICSQAAIR